MSDELTREQIEQIDALYRLATRANQSRAPVMALEQTYDESDLRDTLRSYWPQLRDMALRYLPAPAAPQPTHTDHPLRHWDRTCPACIREGEPTAGLLDELAFLLGRDAKPCPRWKLGVGDCNLTDCDSCRVTRALEAAAALSRPPEPTAELPGDAIPFLCDKGMVVWQNDYDRLKQRLAEAEKDAAPVVSVPVDSFYLGEYTLWDDGTLGKVCISHVSGEGGQFPRFKVEEAIAKFFKENKGAAPVVSVPTPVRLALMVLLNHVEPGWDNSKTVVREWLAAGEGK